MMPGVQNPHWLAPHARNASAQARRSASGEAVERRDHPAGHPPQRRDAGDPGLAVHQDRATAALALGAAAVLHRAGPEAVPQGLRQRAAVVVDGHGAPVDGE